MHINFSIEMNVECLDQSLTTYTQVLQGGNSIYLVPRVNDFFGAQTAMLQIQDKDASCKS